MPLPLFINNKEVAMAFDFKIDPLTRDLRPAFVSGPDEVVQRIVTRLSRERGEWFLNTMAGLAWFGDVGGRIRDRRERLATRGAQGVLGSKNKTRKAVDLLIRREVLATKGVERVLRQNSSYDSGTRAYTARIEVFITGAGAVSLTVSADDKGCITCKRS